MPKVTLEHIVSKKEFLDTLNQVLQNYFADKMEFRGHKLASNKVVLYTGNPKAQIMAIGRDLGEEEILQGEVLIGRAGTYFRKVASNIGFKPLIDFLMCNTVPLRPLNNKAFPKIVRDFFWKNALKYIVEIMDPDFILCLGNEAFQTFVPDAKGILKEAGRIRRLFVCGKHRWIMPCAHPSWVVRGHVTVDETNRHFIMPLQALHKKWKEQKA